MPAVKVITPEQFNELFKPQTNHLDDNASYSGQMYETFGAELEYVRHIDATEPGRVWTLIETDDEDATEGDEPVDDTVLCSGFHLVNRLGYVITQNPVAATDYFEVKDV